MGLLLFILAIKVLGVLVATWVLLVGGLRLAAHGHAVRGTLRIGIFALYVFALLYLRMMSPDIPLFELLVSSVLSVAPGSATSTAPEVLAFVFVQLLPTITVAVWLVSMVRQWRPTSEGRA